MQDCCEHDQGQNSWGHSKNFQHQERLHAQRGGTSQKRERVVRRKIKKQKHKFKLFLVILIIHNVLSPFNTFRPGQDLNNGHWNNGTIWIMDTLVSKTESDMNSGNLSRLYILPFEYLTSLLFRCHSNEPFSYHKFNCLNTVHVRYFDPDCSLVWKKSKIFNPCFELNEFKTLHIFSSPKITNLCNNVLNNEYKSDKCFVIVSVSFNWNWTTQSSVG